MGEKYLIWASREWFLGMAPSKLSSINAEIRFLLLKFTITYLGRDTFSQICNQTCSVLIIQLLSFEVIQKKQL